MKTLYLFIALAFFGHVLSQTCDNPLLKTFGIPSLAAPQAIPDLAYCHDLRSTQSCCSNATVMTFQTQVNALRDRLQNLAGSRDLYITQLRNSYRDSYSSLQDQLDNYNDEISEIVGINGTLGNELKSQYDLLTGIENDLGNINDDFDAALKDYQRLRVGCFTTLLKVQASAWCLACDPDYQSKGVNSDGSITFSNTLCNTISNACFPFMGQGVKFNPYYRARQAVDRLNDVIAYLKEYDDNNNVIPNRTISTGAFKSTNATERTVTSPPDCTDQNNCPWQCQNLFVGGNMLNETLAANGAGLIGGSDVDFQPIGVATTTTQQSVTESQLESAEEEIILSSDVERAIEAVFGDGEATIIAINQNTSSNNRTLQSQTGWAPNIDSTGLLFEVTADPASVTGLQGTGIVEDTDDTDSDLGSFQLAIGGVMITSFVFGTIMI